MDLSDRRRRERFLVDPGELLPADVRFDRLGYLGERHDRPLVDELRELLDVHVRQQVRARRKELAELLIRGPELLERAAELLGSLWVAGRSPTTPISRKTRSR
jgi:hypothetical protein